jgi:hypothetical protein
VPLALSLFQFKKRRIREFWAVATLLYKVHPLAHLTSKKPAAVHLLNPHTIRKQAPTKLKKATPPVSSPPRPFVCNDRSSAMAMAYKMVKTQHLELAPPARRLGLSERSWLTILSLFCACVRGCRRRRG